MIAQTVEIEVPPVRLAGDLSLPAVPAGLVIFAHRSWSSRLSSRQRQVAAALNECGLATLLLGLLTPAEEAELSGPADIDLLRDRLLAATGWAQECTLTETLPIAYFGSSSGAAAALCAVAKLGDGIRAVVSRGGCLEMDCECIEQVSAPTLLIAAADGPLLAVNEQVDERLRCEHELRVLTGASHLFAEPGAPGRVAALAAQWLLPSISEPPRAEPAATAGDARSRAGRSGNTGLPAAAFS